MMIKSVINFIWRFFYAKKIKCLNVNIHPLSFFDSMTVFGGNNVIGKGANVSKSIIGKFSYCGKNSKLENCKIGNFCSIGSDIKVVAVTHPSKDFVSTSPAFFSTKKQCGETFIDKQIFEERLLVNGKKLIIGNDVWIGNNVLIKGGIKIGDGAIVAMGSVVTKDVPSYAIVGGVPAKIIRYRFDKEDIEFLLEDKWWNKSIDWLRKNASQFKNIKQYKEFVKEKFLE